MKELLSAIGESICQRGTSILLQSTLLLATGFGIARLLRRYGPVFQSYLYKALAAAVLVLAVASLLWPASQPSVMSISAAPAESFHLDDMVSLPPNPPTRAITHSSVQIDNAFSGPAIGSSPESKPLTSAGLSSTFNAGANGISPTQPASFSLATILGLAWLFVSAVLVVRLGWGYLRLAGLRKRSQPVTDPAVLTLLRAISQGSGVALMESDEASGPFLAGIIHPTIYLPSCTTMEMERSDVESALLHEVAHLQARDSQWSLARRLLCALLWPQPLVWLLGRAASQAAEEAADQQVVSRGKNESDYASCLLRLAESHQPCYLARVGLGVASSRSAVGRRIERMLGSSGKLLGSLSRRAQFGMALGVAILTGTSLCLISCTGVNTVVAHAQSGANQIQRAQVRPAKVSEWTPPPGYADNFTFAKGKGWSIKPPLWLSNVGGEQTSYKGQTLNLQGLSAEDRALIDEVVKDGETYLLYPENSHPGDGSIKKLQAFLARHPKFAYAEYALGNQYRYWGNQAQAKRWYQASVEDAPVVLARRIQYDDGRPLANFKMCGEEIGIPGKDRLSAGFAAQTDANGCYYLPVWSNELVLQNLMSSLVTSAGGMKPDELMAPSEPRHRFFLPQSHVVLMPPIIVRKSLQVEYPFDNSTNNMRPMNLGDHNLILRWRPYPHAAAYRIGLNETYYLDARGTNTSRMVSLPSAGIDGRSVTTEGTSYTLPLVGYRPALNRKHVYVFLVIALDKNGDDLSTGWSSCFIPSAALGPVELTKQNLERVVPKGVKVLTFERKDSQIFATLDRGTLRARDLISGASFQGYSETVGREEGPSTETIVFKPAIDYGPWTPPGMKRR